MLNLAGLATAAALALFFPGVGLLEQRRRRIERRKAHQAEQLKQLMIEEEKRMARRQDHICAIDLGRQEAEAWRTTGTARHHEHQGNQYSSQYPIIYAECVLCGQPLYIGLALREEVSKWE